MTRFLRACLFLAALFFAAAAVRAADEPASIQRIREEIDRVTRECAERLIAEQPDRAAKADAALIIGALYETGRLQSPDPLVSLDYYRMSAEFGCAEAESALGNAYYQGSDDFPRSIETALMHYEKAAAGGCVNAMLALGVIYADGMGVEADPKKALPYLQDAASRGEAEALRRLDPIMRQAKEWEEAKPGRKSNFPTTREQLIKPELVKQLEARTAELDRKGSRLYVELSKRVGAAVRD